MSSHVLWLGILAVVPTQTSYGNGTIVGLAVNGTQDELPIAGAEVVLRVSDSGSFVPIAETTTDATGRFAFTDLPAGSDIIYLPGVNHSGVHYPGPRIRFDDSFTAPNVKLVAYETAAAPNPLVVHQHEIQVSAEAGVLAVTESLVIDNPSRTTYVGESSGDHPPVTFRISLPDGFETVTFDKEFHGRQFQVHNGRLATDIPWPPGQREMTLFYQLPVEQQARLFTRTLDLPSEHVIVRSSATEGRRVVCNLGEGRRVAGGKTLFEHEGTPLPAGFTLELQLDALPLRFEAYARWLALVLLSVLIVATCSVRLLRRRSAARSDTTFQSADPPRSDRRRQHLPGRRRGSEKRRRRAA